MELPGEKRRPDGERSLYRRLLAALIATICLVCVAQLLTSIHEGRKWVDETLQRLHWELAGEWAHEIQLRSRGPLRFAELDDYFNSQRTFDPTLAVYVLSPTGEVLHRYPSTTPLVRSRVAIEPIRRAMQLSLPKMPLYGDDPATHDRRRVFSVVPTMAESGEGYLYVVITNPSSDLISSWEGIAGHTIYLLPSFLVVTIAGGFILWLLTVYLSMNFKKLIETARHFEAGRYTERVPVDAEDEVGYLARSFNKMAASIVEKEQELKRIEKERRAMVANIAHDLRTPLTSIQGFLQTILLRGEQIDGEQRKRFLSIIERSSERQRQLLENLRALSGLDARERKPDRTVQSMSALVADVAASFEPVAREKSISFACSAGEASLLSRVDRQMMERVVANLISNAIKYTPDGGDVSVRAEGIDDRVRISVSDTGVGIPESDVPRIFDDFYRVKREGYDNPGGTGLGLAIVRRMIELHGSKMQVESAEGKGTTFWFELAATDGVATSPELPTSPEAPVAVLDSYSALPSILRLQGNTEKMGDSPSSLHGLLPDLLIGIGSLFVLLVAVLSGVVLKGLVWCACLYLLLGLRYRCRDPHKPLHYSFYTALISGVCGSITYFFLSPTPDYTFPLIGAIVTLFPGTAPLLMRASITDVIAGVVPASILVIGPFYWLNRYELYMAGVISGLIMSGVLVTSFVFKRNKKLDRRFHLVFVTFVSGLGCIQVLQSTVGWRLVLTQSDQQEYRRVFDATVPRVTEALQHHSSLEALGSLMREMVELSPRSNLMLYDSDRGLVLSKVAMHGRGEGYLFRQPEMSRLIEETIYLRKYAFGFAPPIPDGLAARTIEVDRKKYLFIVGPNPLYKITKRKVEETSAAVLAIWVAVVTLVCGFLLRISSKKYVIDRVAQLVDVMRRIDGGELTARFPRTVGDEIDRIGKTLNQMADTIVRKLEALRYSDQQRRLLIRAIAETLREPLSAMQCSVNQMISTNAELELDALQRYSQDVQKAVRAQYHLVEDLFDFSKLEVDELKPNPEPLLLGELLQDATLQIEEKLESREVSLVFDIQDQMPFAVGDVGMLSKALEVLIEYAVLRTPPGAAVCVQCSATDETIDVKISDGQLEFPPVDIVREDISFVAKTEGIGYSVDCNPLRLTLARRFIELHQSKLEVQFALGGGGTYRFSLPVDKTPRSSESAQRALPASLPV